MTSKRLRGSHVALLTAAQESRCFYCDRGIYNAEATIDHFLSRWHGGSNTIGNMVLCCYECNEQKGNRLPYWAEAHNWKRLNIRLREISPGLRDSGIYLAGYDLTRTALVVMKVVEEDEL